MPDRMLEYLIICLITVMRCPGRRLISGKRGTLAEERPDLVKQWVDEANKDATPDTVGAASQYLATWQCGCSCKHCSAPHPSWQAYVHARTAGSGCPYCSGHKVCVCQSVAALYPDLVKELDPASTPELDPKLWPLAATNMHPGCAPCMAHGLPELATGSGAPGAQAAHFPQIVVSKPGRGFLKDECPEIFAQLHPTLNGNLKALAEITCGSDAKLWWLCKEDKNRPQGCQHEHAWQTVARHRCRARKPSGCPFCAGMQVCQCNSISKLKPELLQFWDYSRNVNIKPDNLGLSSARKVWWHHDCRATDEEHVWQTSPNNFLSGYQKASRAPCPICKGRAHETMIQMGRTTKIKM